MLHKEKKEKGKKKKETDKEKDGWWGMDTSFTSFIHPVISQASAPNGSASQKTKSNDQGQLVFLKPSMSMHPLS